MQHFLRWISALVLVPIILLIILKATTFWLAVLVCVVALLSMGEYLKIVYSRNGTTPPVAIILISYAVSISLIMAACLASWEIEFLILSLNLLALSVFALSQFANNHNVFEILAKQVLGIIYIPASLCLAIFIKEFDQGVFWVIWLLIVVFLNDTGAFYSGKFLGKHKLAPNISPNKTIEGSIGGIISSVTVGFIFNIIFFNNLSLAFLMIPASFIIAIAGQAGDLFESGMKRASGVKDSGSILPGHGGMLDRIDGLLFAIPVFYIYQVFVL